MKIAIIADSHFDEGSRFTECIRLHQEIERWVTENKPALVCHAGDIFEGTSTPREREAVAGWLQDIAMTCPVVLVAGNHDKALDVEFLERLRGRHQIIARERPGVERVAGVDVACLPWPRKAHLLAALGGVSQEQAGAVAQEALRDVLRGLGAQLDHSAPSLLLSHAMVRGSRTSHGQPLVGMDMELGLDDLALVGADAYALGHVHMRQEWEIDGSPVFYPGSPRRTAFGELEAKGFYVLDFEQMPDGSWGCGVEFVELPATRMLLVEAEWAQGGFGTLSEFVPAGSEIRFRYRVRAEDRDAAKAEAERLRGEWNAAGAVQVKVEQEVIAEARARAPGIAKASTLEDQLLTHWLSVGFDPGQRRQPLLDKLSALQSEVTL